MNTNNPPANGPSAERAHRGTISAAQQRDLLAFARSVAGIHLGVAGSSSAKRPTIEGRFGGAFVTFWNKQALRGCVGSLSPTNDLVGTIESITKASLNDQRFAGNRITANELPAITTEISILSDPTPTDNPAALVPGLHGIVVRQGVRSGCFLPKVASERKWSAEEFLSNCCTMKAGLAADAWKSRNTEVLLFTAEVFSDEAQPWHAPG